MKNKKINLLIGVIAGLLLAAGYAIIGVQNVKEEQRENIRQRHLASITYLKKQDVAELLALPTDNADYIWEVLVGDGGYSLWHTQKLFLLRYKPVYDLIMERNIRFKVYMGDAKKTSGTGNLDFSKDAAEIARLQGIAPLEYRILDKQGNLILNTRGSIPTKEAVSLLNTALGLKAGSECKLIDYIKIQEARVKKMHERMEARAKARLAKREAERLKNLSPEQLKKLNEEREKAKQAKEQEKIKAQEKAKAVEAAKSAAKAEAAKPKSTLFESQAPGITPAPVQREQSRPSTLTAPKAENAPTQTKRQSTLY